jgi:hypothetical protein
LSAIGIRCVIDPKSFGWRVSSTPGGGVSGEPALTTIG